MKKYQLFLLLTFLLLNSCNSEDNFIDLSPFNDFMIELTVFFNSNSTGNYKFDTEYFKTNGFDQLITEPASFEGSMPSNHQSTFFKVVKEYKKVGVKIMAIDNIVGYKLRISAISGYPDGETVVNIENNLYDNEETTIIYNFESNELFIN
ncbi:MAG TPA: hypothetical protein ENK46_06400 [Flavobacteriia bacterium]|nr:hypothetical protein [Flavobacteriia bacterium]